MTQSGTLQIFDQALVRQRWRKVAAQDHPALQLAAELLAERLADIKRPFTTILELGGRSHDLTNLCYPLAEDYQVQPLWVGDGEALNLPSSSYDLILSSMVLHWINDLPGHLKQIYDALKPGGLFMAVMAGGRTLQELRSVLMATETQISGGISPRVSPMVDQLTASQLLQRAGFQLPVVDSELVQFSYAGMQQLMQDLRTMGAANALVARSRKTPSRLMFQQAAARYQAGFPAAEGVGITATLELVFLHGWRD